MSDKPTPSTVDPGSLAMLRRLFLEHGRPHLKSYVLAGLFMAIGAAATSVSAWLLKPVLNRMVDPAGFADLRWLAVLRDPQLVALVTEAVANNPDLREAQGRVREYRAQLGVARSGFFPQVSANTATSRNQVAFGPQVVGFDAVRATGDAWSAARWRCRVLASYWRRGHRTPRCRRVTVVRLSCDTSS